MRFAKGQDMPEAHFDLTPMIDVVLLLIIFFMLTAQFARTLKTPMELPEEPGAGTTDQSPAALVVDLTKDGQLRLATEPIGLEAFLQIISADLKKAKAAGNSQPFDLTVRVDRACPAVHLNGLAGALTQLGVRNWKLATASSGSPATGAAGGGGK
jgi:biopolymer transport protein ExbD